MSWIDQIPEAARLYLDQHRLDEVECVIADLPGIARGKAVPAAKWERQQFFHLPNSIFFQTITGDWGEAAGPEGFVEPDMVLRPDLATTTAAPWAADGTLQVIHDAYDQKGRPVGCSPRNVLKRVVDLYKAEGWTPVVAPEMEFYLVGRNVDPAKAIEPMLGRTGRPAAARQAYSMTAVDEYGPVSDDIYEYAEIQGFEIDGITQEGGAGQLEINLRHGNPIKLADEVFYFKRLIREAALRHNCLPPSWPSRSGTSRDRPCTCTTRFSTWKPVRTSLPDRKAAKRMRSSSLSPGCSGTCPTRWRCWRHT